MHVDLIREALHRQPFDPIVLRLVDGRSVPVPHPDFVALSRPEAPFATPQRQREYGELVSLAFTVCLVLFLVKGFIASKEYRERFGQP